MNSQFSPARPEAKPNVEPITGEPVPITTGGSIVFHQASQITDPNEPIKQGELTSLEEYKRRAFDAMGIPSEKKAA